MENNTGMELTQRSWSRTGMDSIKGLPSAENAAANMEEFVRALEDIQSIDIKKLKAQFFQTEETISQNMADDLMIEPNRILDSQKKETDIVRKQLEEELKFRKEYESAFGDRKINDLSRMLEDMFSAIERLEKETERLKENNRHLEVEKQNALEEKTNALTRLSKQVSDQMTENNPNIADQFSQNRPSKLGERYSEVYDNQWTIAFEVLTETYGEVDETAIQILLNLLIECDNFAKMRAEIQMEELVRTVTGSLSVQVGNEIKLHLKKARQLVDFSSVGLLFQDCESYVNRRVAVAKVYLKEDEDMKTYLKECFQICWLMAIQDLPVVLGHVPKRFEDFNTMLYKPYSWSGTKVDFAVWPPLLLHEGGPVLAKGVAQPILEKRKEDFRLVKQIRRTAWGEGHKTKYQERVTQTKLKQDDVDFITQATIMKIEDIPRGRIDERKQQLTTVPTTSSQVIGAKPTTIVVSTAGNTKSATNQSRYTDISSYMQPVKTTFTQTSVPRGQDYYTAPAYKNRSKQITTKRFENSQKLPRTDGKIKHDDSTPSRITQNTFLSRHRDHGYEHLNGTELHEYRDFVQILTNHGLEMARSMFRNAFERYITIYMARK
ncbi:hypothetical protein CHS0354_026351 [Potamilus streckersoni]|nr:hypothetical protein CHS0354_026351 [Potamilus streckersoni]